VHHFVFSLSGEERQNYSQYTLRQTCWMAREFTQTWMNVCQQNAWVCYPCT